MVQKGWGKVGGKDCNTFTKDIFFLSLWNPECQLLSIYTITVSLNIVPHSHCPQASTKANFRAPTSGGCSTETVYGSHSKTMSVRPESQYIGPDWTEKLTSEWQTISHVPLNFVFISQKLKLEKPSWAWISLFIVFLMAWPFYFKKVSFW